MWKNLLNSLPLLLGVGAIAYSCTSTNSVEIIDSKLDYVDSLPVCDVVPGSVYDGDTIRVNCGTGETKIRFACIDAPEVKPSQSMGIESRDNLRKILDFAENKVRVDAITTDRYGRTVAELWVDMGLVQSLQAIDGMAWGYEQYKDDCKSWDAVASSEATARSEGKGIWGTSNPIPPWKFRRQ
jgi:endonuclease YncB( thermonuclease family)